MARANWCDSLVRQRCGGSYEQGGEQSHGRAEIGTGDSGDWDFRERERAGGLRRDDCGAASANAEADWSFLLGTKKKSDGFEPGDTRQRAGSREMATDGDVCLTGARQNPCGWRGARRWRKG